MNLSAFLFFPVFGQTLYLFVFQLPDKRFIRAGMHYLIELVPVVVDQAHSLYNNVVGYPTAVLLLHPVFNRHINAFSCNNLRLDNCIISIVRLISIYELFICIGLNLPYICPFEEIGVQCDKLFLSSGVLCFQNRARERFAISSKSKRSLIVLRIAALRSLVFPGFFISLFFKISMTLSVVCFTNAVGSPAQAAATNNKTIRHPEKTAYSKLLRFINPPP